MQALLGSTAELVRTAWNALTVGAVACALLAGGVACRAPFDGTPRAVVHAGFWFEGGLAYRSDRLGTAISVDDLEAIDQVARAEVAKAFEGLRIALSDRRDARYSVRVVQRVRDPRVKREMDVAGESRGLAGFGGQGSVSFQFLASGAVTYAPADADRAALVRAIGTGIGRAAVHEFTHQFFPTAPIHDSRDVGSYEYRSAARPEQYFGEMRWSVARPLLERKFGH